MEHYRILKASKDRMPEVAIVLRTSFRVTYPNFPELHTSEEDREYFTNVVFEKDEVYIAEDSDSGRIVGFIAFNKKFIDHLYLLPEAQRIVLGSQLLEIAKAQSNHLQLWTFQQNTVARTFYEKRGFHAVRLTDGDNDEKQPDVLYDWVK